MTSLRVLFSVLALAFMALPACSETHLRFCEGQTEYFTVKNDLEGNRLDFHHQEFGLGDEGTYTFDAIPRQNFKMDAFVYERSDAQQEWTFVHKETDVSTFSYQVQPGSYGRLVLFQLINRESKTCAACVINMTMTASNCKKSDKDKTPATKVCQPDTCFAGSSLFGLPNCIPKKGADGGPC